MNNFAQWICSQLPRCVILLILVHWLSQAATAIGYRAVAVRYQVAQGTNSSSQFDTFGSFVYSASEPVINDAGQVAFLSRLRVGCPPCGGPVNGIWSEGSGVLSPVAIDGPVPGAEAGAEFTGFVQPVFNNLGQSAFVGAIVGPGIPPNNQGIWSEGSGSLKLVARIGDPAPGAGTGASFTSFRPPVLNQSGEVAFFASASNTTGIWAQRDESLRLVMRYGMPAPGAGAAAAFGPADSPTMNGLGQTAFFNRLQGTGVNSSNDVGIWSEGGGSLHLVAREGAPAPGVGANVYFDRLYFSPGHSPAFNDAGQVAIRASIKGPGIVGGINSGGVWSGDGSDLRLVAQSGLVAPNVDDGTVFGYFESPTLNAKGEVAFVSFLKGPGIDSNKNEKGIWSEGGGALHLVARQGMETPGLPGWRFRGIADSIELNDQGETAFVAYIGESGDVPLFKSIWTGGPDGLQLVARVGQTIRNGSGDVFTIGNLSVAFDADSFDGGASQDGRPRAFNNHGQLTFRTEMTNAYGDLSFGIFVADLTIPEPGTTVLLFIGATALILSRWGR